MKIRTRITLFVVVSGLVSSVLISIWLIYELLEQPFRVLDTAYVRGCRTHRADPGKARRGKS
jgi:hypothetical protein